MDSPLIEAMTPYTTTIFTEMSKLAVRTESVNLGQGFPDEEGPAFLVDAACRAIRDGHNQYAPGAGVPELLRAVADHQQRFYGIELDPNTQILVTVGATEAVAAALLAMVEPGDEVITFEPFYDSYPAMVARAGGVLKAVPLTFPDASYDPEVLEAAFSDRTRVILLNTPHNPTGKIFTEAELRHVAELAERHDAWILTDEVYEHLVLGDQPHVPISTLPEAAQRTLTVSSAGKTFSMTGWKVGWISGPAVAIDAVRAMKQFMSFSACGPFQYAIAEGLAMDDAGYDELPTQLRARRAQLLDGLSDIGLTTNHPESTYFVIADLAPLGLRDAMAGMPEFAARHGVVGVPVSAFHSGAFPEVDEHAAALVRFAFCKRPELIDEGISRLRAVAT
ncbi:MAG: aminotransferase class I/II-fold pyridoxal phosphate-dependent enzyme [Mobilicoccus sp.]|nr:aminotransferase class I/II-fold pyridoxal phosphate-dependent enzyme [Mobilicoccus sp.]